ncbi:phosphatase PAP2 family protein [Streptomyces sp. A7024]|uniref:Phosphatase PAP2 family protein n=1 Tax=Streptomyces coryli TaxID=1128680 RepID=A0A6G4TZB0_9ACTN|nr:phosphatase PAP2 family protein [Streptomyces coryli]NGN65163.1 phosphatase PAP2 family protein [Streptomyces coryli]
MPWPYDDDTPTSVAGAPPSGSNPDVSVLQDINGIAGSTPHWLDRSIAFAGEYGLVLLLGLLLVACWWRVRRSDPQSATASVAALLWAPCAAAIAILVNVPLRNFVERPRPFVDHHDGITLLLSGKGGYSFVSDHATIAAALAVGIYMADRRFGIAALVIALTEGLSRVYLGVHYPSDVVGGFALGTAVALLLAPFGTAWLGRLVRYVPWLAPGSTAEAEGAAAIPAPGRSTEQQLWEDPGKAA